MGTSELDATKDKIRDLVSEHYCEKEEPYLLSRLGVRLSREGVTLPEGVGLKGFIQLHLDNDHVIVQDPQNRVVVAVAPKDKKAVVQKLLDEHRKDVVDTWQELQRLPRSLLIAFCYNPPEKERVFYRVSPPFRYYIGEEPPDDVHLEIQARFRQPELYVSELAKIPPDAARKLSLNIRDWMDANKLDPVFFNPSRSARQQVLPTTASALDRLVDAQAPEVRRLMLIPADIAQLLASH